MSNKNNKNNKQTLLFIHTFNDNTKMKHTHLTINRKH